MRRLGIRICAAVRAPCQFFPRSFRRYSTAWGLALVIVIAVLVLVRLDAATQIKESILKHDMSTKTSLSPDRCMSPNLPYVNMSVYRMNPARRSVFIACPVGAIAQDIVCKTVKEQGEWEPFIDEAIMYSLRNLRMTTNKPPLFVDIGGNVGSISVPVAVRGVEVHVVEMLPRNLQLLTVSRCLNHLEGRLHIHPYALGRSPHKGCRMLSYGEANGDAFLQCGSLDPSSPASKAHDHGAVDVVTLDKLYMENLREEMDHGRHVVVKIDVEGNEIEVFEGALLFLSHPRRPQLIISEVWRQINVTRYAEVMFSHGYIGYAYALAQFLGNVQDAGQYHQKLHVAIDTIAWMTWEHAPVFVQHPISGGDQSVSRRSPMKVALAHLFEHFKARMKHW